MARRPRGDRPGVWFHLMNRGIARRTMFERREDMAVFLGHLGAASERGEIEVHAFSILTTHYHLLARSPAGQIHKAMHRVQTEYSRWFNRSRRRDGPLVRSRYRSREVDSLEYQCTLIRYIDMNPVWAGLVQSPENYPYGSARLYRFARREALPWLERGWIEAEVCRTVGREPYDPESYGRVFGPLPREQARSVEARWRSRAVAEPLDDLVGASPAAVVAWMKRKARLADGTRPGQPVFLADTLDRAIEVAMAETGGFWTIGRRCGWNVARIGLSRHLCGLTLGEVGSRVLLTDSSVWSVVQLHRRLLHSDSLYGQRVAAVVRCLARSSDHTPAIR